jgi:hypothetical protein
MSTPPTVKPPRRIKWKVVFSFIGTLILATSAIIAAVIASNRPATPPSTPVVATFVSSSPTTIPSATSGNSTVLTPEQAETQYLHIINTTSPTLSDSLTAQNSNTWDVDTSNNASRGCAFQNGAYHAFAARQDVVECLAKGLSYGNNFVYQVQMTTTKGDGGGIIFGSSVSDSLIKYRFYVNTGSYCDLFVPLNGGQRLFNSSHAPIISGSNLIAVMVISHTMYLFINEKYVGLAHTIDGGPLSGQIGLFAEEVNSTTDLVFSELHVWQE